MSKPETRGYLVGLNQNNQFVIPKKLMEKIVETTGETSLLIWLQHKKSLQIQPIVANKVIKFTIWFEVITHTIFESKLNPTLDQYNDILIYKTGVLFPMDVDEMSTVEYYFKFGEEHDERMAQLKAEVEDIEGIGKVELRYLERYTGE